MDNFVSVILKTRELDENAIVEAMLDALDAPLAERTNEYGLFESENESVVVRLQTPYELDEEESDAFAQAFANRMFEMGYDDFEIETSLEEALDAKLNAAIQAIKSNGSMWRKAKQGSINSDEVKTIQQALNQLGFDAGKADGWFGKKTANAVRAYQKANGLKVDGDPGPNTLKSMAGNPKLTGKLDQKGATPKAPQGMPDESDPTQDAGGEPSQKLDTKGETPPPVAKPRNKEIDPNVAKELPSTNTSLDPDSKDPRVGSDDQGVRPGRKVYDPDKQYQAKDKYYIAQLTGPDGEKLNQYVIIQPDGKIFEPKGRFTDAKMDQMKDEVARMNKQQSKQPADKDAAAGKAKDPAEEIKNFDPEQGVKDATGTNVVTKGTVRKAIQQEVSNGNHMKAAMIAATYQKIGDISDADVEKLNKMAKKQAQELGIMPPEAEPADDTATSSGPSTRGRGGAKSAEADPGIKLADTVGHPSEWTVIPVGDQFAVADANGDVIKGTQTDTEEDAKLALDGYKYNKELDNRPKSGDDDTATSSGPSTRGKAGGRLDKLKDEWNELKDGGSPDEITKFLKDLNAEQKRALKIDPLASTAKDLGMDKQPEVDTDGPTMGSNDTDSDSAPNVSSKSDSEVNKDTPKPPQFPGGERTPGIDTTTPASSASSVSPKVATAVAQSFTGSLDRMFQGSRARGLRAQLKRLENPDTFTAAIEKYEEETGNSFFKDLYDKVNDRRFKKFIEPELKRLDIDIPDRGEFESIHESADFEDVAFFEETYDDDDEFHEAYGWIGLPDDELWEAEYRGRKVKLNKPMRGDVKKFKVYVKNKKGNVIKVNFGDPNSKIKKSNPARRRSFRARHNCDNPGPKTKARYWSCRKW